MGKPKLGMSIYTYGSGVQSRRMTVEQAIEHAASLGVKGIEIVDKQHVPNYPHVRIHDLERLRDCIKSFGMEMACYSTYVDSRVRFDREATIEEMIDNVHEQVAQASVLGAKVLRPGFVGIIHGDFKGDKAEAGFQMQTRIINEVLPELKKHSIVWGQEIHAPMPPSFLLTLMKRVNDKSVGIVPDFSVWETKQPWEQQSASATVVYPPETIKPVLPYAVHVHAKAHVFNEKGEEPNIPYGKLIGLIKESNFNGYISAEYEGMTGPDVDSRKMARTHIELIKRYL